MKLRHIILLSIAVLLFGTNVDAQCAMCKAVAETGSSDGIPVSGGINQAIFYLMALPYIIMFLLFRKKIVSFFREWKAMWK
jgi:ADP-ribosylglycohydrolase